MTDPATATPAGLQTRRARLLTALREFTDRRVVILFFLGFASGLPLLLALSTLTAWLTEAGLTKAGIAAFQYVGTAWTLKFLWAPAVDRLRLPVLYRRFGQRRSWMLAALAGIAATLYGLSHLDPMSSLGAIAALAVVLAFFSATFDIALDAWRVETLPDRLQGAGSSVVQFGYRIAMLVTGAGALFIASRLRTDSEEATIVARAVFRRALEQIEQLGEQVGNLTAPNLHMASEVWPLVYRVMALLVFVGVAATLIAPEPEEQAGDSSAPDNAFRDAIIEPFRTFFVAQGGLKTASLVLLFVMFFRLSDSIAGSLANPFLIDIGFAYGEIARIQKLFGFVATIIGTFAGGLLFRAIGAFPTLWIAAIFQALSNLMFVWQAQAGADTQLLHLTIGIENISGGLGAGAFVAWLSLLCSKRYSATQYALLSALAMVGRIAVAGSLGFIVDLYGWPAFFIVSTAAGIPGWFLLYMLGKERGDRSARSEP